jgi:PhzF family phenazine biosynthesis protein
MTDAAILRLAAFTDDPRGGNPAGVVIGPTLPDPAEMQRIAADVGYSETAFLAGDGGSRWTTRYWSPAAEVPFCGHATIASAIALHDRFGVGAVELETTVGTVPVSIEQQDGGVLATLTSVEPSVADLDDDDLALLLGHLGWGRLQLDPALPPRVGFAGAHHPVIAVRDRAILASLSYDFDGLRALMEDRDWTTIQIVWRASPTVFHARDPFPVGGVVEDPATGAAAAAFGAYLRALRLVDVPATVTIHQGEDLGRPSLISVAIPATGGIRVSGAAVPIA